MKITTQDAVSLLEQVRKENSGRVFTVSFIKRTTGELRVMNARFNVKAYLQGGELKFNPKEKSLMTCFDMQKMAYRMINLLDLKAIKINGKEYQVV